MLEARVFNETADGVCCVPCAGMARVRRAAGRLNLLCCGGFAAPTRPALAQLDVNPTLTEPVRLKVSQGIVGLVVADGETVMVDDAYQVRAHSPHPAASRATTARLRSGADLIGMRTRCRPRVTFPSRQHPRFHADLDAKTGMTTRSLLCVPLRHGKTVLGAVEWINKLDSDVSPAPRRVLAHGRD